MLETCLNCNEVAIELACKPSTASADIEHEVPPKQHLFTVVRS